MKINKRWNDESFIADLFEITENRVFCNGNRYFGNLFLVVIIRPLHTFTRYWRRRVYFDTGEYIQFQQNTNDLVGVTARSFTDCSYI